jgi:probable phosphoglycerate mutase
MSHALPEIHLVRHGETEWTQARRHTGRTDIPLTELGEHQALRFAGHIRGRTYAEVRTSPRQRARRTCELAGFGTVARVEPDLAEWDYGEYEGLTTEEILSRRPGWHLFKDGCPGGESVDDVGRRADRVITTLRAGGEDFLLFSSGHFLRVLAARWLGLAASFGRFLVLSTATLSILGYEHSPAEPAIRLWNDVRPGAD